MRSTMLWYGRIGLLTVAMGGGAVVPVEAAARGQVPGDCNQDGTLDISDAICLLQYLFTGYPSALPCDAGAPYDDANLDLLDANGDDSLDLADAVRTLSYLFAGGAPHVLGTDCIEIDGCPGLCTVVPSTTEPDSDGDGLSDEDETDGFFGYDFVELEDYVESSNILNHQYGVILRENGSYVKLSSSLDPGYYSFYVSGTADIDPDATLEAINLFVNGRSLQDIDRYWSRYQSGTLVTTHEFTSRLPLFQGPTALPPGDVLYDPATDSFYMVRVVAQTVEVRHYDLTWNPRYDMGGLNHDHVIVFPVPNPAYRLPRIVKAGDHFYVGCSLGSNQITLRKFTEDWTLVSEIYSSQNPLIGRWGDLDYDAANAWFLVTSDANPYVQIDVYGDAWSLMDTVIVEDPGYTFSSADLLVSDHDYVLAYSVAIPLYDIHVRRSPDLVGLSGAAPAVVTTEPGNEMGPHLAVKGGEVYMAYISDETWDGVSGDYVSDIFLVKIDGTGQPLWKQRLTSPAESEAKTDPLLLNAGGKLHLLYYYSPDEAGQDPPRSYFALYPGQVETPALRMYWVLTGAIDIAVAGDQVLTFALNHTPASSAINNVRSDRLIIRRQGADPLDADTDGDGVPDGDEWLSGSFVLNSDPDEDGLSDGVELDLGTNPLRRDSDGDGVLDAIELGYAGGDVDPFTVWDTDTPAGHGPLARANIDADPDTVTDPMNVDSDGDGLPDGWVDGWSYGAGSGWALDPEAAETWSGHHDGPQREAAVQRWEGEDFDGNGLADAGARFLWSYAPPVAESRSDLWDSDEDGVPDGWEARYAFDPNDPSDAAGDSDTGTDADLITSPSQIQTVEPDGATNGDEYRMGTSPRNQDSDGDGLLDGEEGSLVLWRTNVPAGAERFAGYGSLAARGIYEWVAYDGAEYGYERTVTIEGGIALPPDFPSYTDYLNSSWPVLELPDETVIMVDHAGGRVYVWQPFSLFSRPGFQGDYRGRVHVYALSESQGLAETSSAPHPDYAGRELYQTDPRDPDSDGDGIRDGDERQWSSDQDGDGLVNARDRDCDGDTLLNELELDPDGDPDGDGVPNVLDEDSDDDGILDGRERNPLQDFDGDGLPTIIDPDADNDGLPDGWRDADGNGHADPGEYEDKNGDGVLDAGETDPLDVDSDGDGLWDGADQTLVAGSHLWRTFAHYHDFFYQGRFRYSHRETYRGELTAGTDPREADTDSDGVLDGDEVYGWAVTVRLLGQPGSAEDFQPDPPPYVMSYASGGWPRTHLVAVSDPRVPDTDGDGLTDGGEFEHGTRPDHEDTDRDGIPDAEEVLLSYGGVRLDPRAMDSDFDYLPDGWVDFDGDGVQDPGEGEDLDADGTVDAAETNPLLADTDGDGVRDGLERGVVVFRATSGTYQDQASEIAADIGETGLRRFGFSRTAATLPGQAVTLGFLTPEGHDLFFDPAGGELFVDAGAQYAVFATITGGTVPVLVNPLYEFAGHEVTRAVSDPLDSDSDGDGLSDGEEFYLLSLFCSRFCSLFDPDGDGTTNFHDTDSDGDGLPDAWDPYSTDQGSHWWKDVDGDGLPCALDTDSDEDTFSDGVDDTPLLGDADLDGAPDDEEESYGLDDESADTDGDGLLDGLEAYSADSDGDGAYNGADQDADNDGLPDGWMDGYRWDGSAFVYDADLDDGAPQACEGEDLNVNGLLDPGESSPLHADTDGDGLWDGYSGGAGAQAHHGELTYGSDPRNADTDGDGLTDGAEVSDFYLERILPVTRGDTEFYFISLASGDYRLTVISEVNGNNDTHDMSVAVTAAGESDPLVSFDQDPLDMSSAQYLGYLGVYEVTTDVDLGSIAIGVYHVAIAMDAGSWVVGIRLMRRGLDPTREDTDGDGLADGDELLWGTAPGNPDTDGDGLRDGMEAEQGINPLSADTDGDCFPDHMDLQPTSLWYSEHSGVKSNWRAFWLGHEYQHDLAPGMSRFTQEWVVYNGRHSSRDYRDDEEYWDRYAPSVYFEYMAEVYAEWFDTDIGNFDEFLQSHLANEFFLYFPYSRYRIYHREMTGRGGFYQNRVDGREVDDYWYFVSEDMTLSFENSVPVATDLLYLLLKVTLQPGADQNVTFQFFSPLSAEEGKEIFLYYKLYHENDYAPFYDGCLKATALDDADVSDITGEHTRTLYAADFLFPADLAPASGDEECYLYVVPMVREGESPVQSAGDYIAGGAVIISAVASVTQSVVCDPVLVLSRPDVDQQAVIEAYLDGEYPISGTGEVAGEPALFFDLDHESGLQAAVTGGTYAVLFLSSRSIKDLSLCTYDITWPADWSDHAQIDYAAQEYWGNEALISTNLLIGYDSLDLYRDIREDAFYVARPLSDNPDRMALLVEEGRRTMLNKYVFKLPDTADQTATIYTASTATIADALFHPLVPNGGHGVRRPVAYQAVSVIERRDSGQELHIQEESATVSALETRLAGTDPIIALVVDGGLIFEATIDDLTGNPPPDDMELEFAIYTPEGGISLTGVGLDVAGAIDKYGMGEFSTAASGAFTAYYCAKAWQSDNATQRQYYTEQAVGNAAALGIAFIPGAGQVFALADLGTMALTTVVDEYYEPWPDYLRGAGIIKLAIQDFYWYGDWGLEIMEDIGVTAFIESILGIDLPDGLTSSDEKYANAAEGFETLSMLMEGLWNHTDPSDGSPDPILNTYMGQDPPPPPE